MTTEIETGASVSPTPKRKRARHDAEQFEFAFARRRTAAPRMVFTQLEFPLSIRRVRRRERPNFSEFKQLAMLLRCQKENVGDLRTPTAT